MPTEKADIYTLASFGDYDNFKRKFRLKDINKCDEYGYNLLHAALSGNHFKIALFLINNNIDLNMTDPDKNTALHYICERQIINENKNQNVILAEKMLQKGANINIRNKYGNNAMWTAVFNCKGRNYEMVELFMKYNPDIHTKNKAGRSPLDFAKQVGDEKLVRLLENN